MSSAFAPPPQSFGAVSSGGGPPPPPRGLNQSPSRVPYTQATSLPAWNDLPEGFAKAPTPRRGTPSAVGSVISTPFPNQHNLGNQVSRPDSRHQPALPRQRTPVPPPPKKPGAPPVPCPLSTGPPQGSQGAERPPSSSNPYSTV